MAVIASKGSDPFNSGEDRKTGGSYVNEDGLAIPAFDR